jgi:hypothetical protein
VNAQDLHEGLAQTGYPVRYRAFKQPPALPYIVYLFANSADLMADNENYQTLSDFQVELYSEDKDLMAEAAVEAALKGMGLAWAKSEAYIDSEQMVEILYEVRIVETDGGIS